MKLLRCYAAKKILFKMFTAAQERIRGRHCLTALSITIVPIPQWFAVETRPHFKLHELATYQRFNSHIGFVFTRIKSSLRFL